MQKSISKQKHGRCIFCEQTGKRTQTHVWPDWLKSILTSGTHGLDSDEAVIHINVEKTDTIKRTRVRQGGMFSQKPYLACQKCNTGWMNDFEKPVIIFAKSLFASDDAVKLTRKQVRSLCCWLSLIAILAEYNVKREKSSIPKIDRQYIKENLEHPGEWSIFACSQDNPTLLPFHATTRKWYDQNMRAEEHAKAIVEGRDNLDTQLSIFGLGRVAFQLFTSLHMRLVTDFRTYVKHQGFIQLWPMPSILNPFSSRVQFPTSALLDVNEIGQLHSAYTARFEMLFGAGRVGRFRND
jgi:hypothetical protein